MRVRFLCIMYHFLDLSCLSAFSGIRLVLSKAAEVGGSVKIFGKPLNPTPLNY